MELPDSVKAIGEQVEHQRETGGGEIRPTPELFEAYDVFAAELAQIFTQPWLAVDHASRLAADGDFVRADYYFNPVVAGFRDTGGAGWRGSPWHADIASKDEKKLAYLRELKATGEALFERLKGVVK